MNKTRCPWCGKLVDKQADARRYAKEYMLTVIFRRGRIFNHHGVCAHCGNAYSNTINTAIKLSLYIASVVLIFSGFSLGIWILIAIGLALFIFSLLYFLFATRFRRIYGDNGFTIENDKNLFVRMRVIDQYYELRRGEILLLFKDHDAHEPFSRVSPISVSKLDEKAGILEGYWLYDHCDNAYFASLDQVHLYDDDGNVVADITFKEKIQNG